MANTRRPPPPGRASADRIERRRAAVAKRRARDRRMVALEAKRRRRRMFVRVGAVVLLVAAIGGTVGVVLARREDPPPSIDLTSPVVEGATGELGITDPPSAYRVAYRLDGISTSGETITTQEYVIRRPFDSLVTAKDGEPPGTTEQFKLVWTLDRYSQSSAGGEAQVGQTAPAPALGDLRLDATLADLVATGEFVPRERRTVLGRECQVYRTGQPLERLVVAAPTDTDYVDACIDSSGLLLEELTVAGGSLAGRLIVTEIDTEATPGDDVFAVTGEPKPLAEGGSTLTEVDQATSPVPGYWLLDTPEGYEHRARYLLEQPSDDAASAATTTVPGATSTTVAAAPLQSYVDVYVNGTSTIIMRQGPTAAGPSADEAATTAELGALGTVEVDSTLTGTTIVGRPTAPADWFVAVSGTLPRAEVEPLVAGLHT